jgi:TetR/AcrR family transcriptional regulator, transcriptional repressor for nem operon
MASETSDRPKLTAKGARTRGRIVEEAAALIHERGVAGTTLEDVKAAAEVSGSQMYHYFPDKDDLVQAVIDHNATGIVSRNRQALSAANGVEAWRRMVIAAAKRTKAKGGCALGSLVGQLAESDPEARALIAAGFDQWAAAIGDGLRSLHT